MKPQEARALVHDTFSQPYDEGRLRLLIRNLFHDLTEKDDRWSGSYIPEAFCAYVSQYRRLGKVEDPKGDTVDILAVKLTSTARLVSARTAQRNFVARYLNGGRGGQLRDAALVAFYSGDSSDWRFSLVRMDYSLDAENQKIKKELTPARRYSFLVGPDEGTHTAEEQLSRLLTEDSAITLADLEQAFNLETVTREFFAKYKALYLDLKEELDALAERSPGIHAEFERKQIDTANFAKRLLGQIVFLTFLQKKGWLGVKRGEPWGTGPKDFLQQLFAREQGAAAPCSAAPCFFNDVLEPLFYDALARERDDNYVPLFDCRIPFLNGGLFEPIGGYDWVNVDIPLSNERFADIFNVFDLYNFTVREDEPLDKEVAVDPEMLGKVFENLLEVSDRKSKGAFYTPREIVHYMCQESLIAYLDTSLNKGLQHLLNKGLQPLVQHQQKPIQEDLFGRPQTKQGELYREVYEERVPRADLEAFIRHGDVATEHDAATAQKERETEDYSFKTPESIRQHAKELDDKLANIKICDPAIGSGAFPVGMMNEIVRARLALTSYLQGRPAAMDAEPPTVGEEPPIVNAEPPIVTVNKGLQPLVHTRTRTSARTPKEQVGRERTPYAFKRHAIGESIYGVDIDASAVDIAKLRLWLSLVVDEDDFETIQPLPNLDYKIVAGNSLLSVEETLFNNDLFERLEKLKDEYFDETRHGRKGELKREIDGIIGELTEGGGFDFRVYFSEVFQRRTLEQHAYHITWVTHNSRVSERMVTFGVERGEPVLLTAEEEREITASIAEMVREEGLRVLAYNICRDHVHLVLVCAERERSNIVRKLKGKSAQRYKERHGIQAPFHLWAQKYNCSYLESEEKLHNALQYVSANREKHGLPLNKGLQPLVQEVLTPLSRAFEPVTVGKGGFDVVIGNPPYVRQESLGALKQRLKGRFETYHGTADLFVYFIELGVKLLNKGGTFCYIVANKWMRANYGKPLRRWLKKQGITKLIDFGDLPVFETATTYPCILFVQNTPAKREPAGREGLPMNKGLQPLVQEMLQPLVPTYVNVVKMNELALDRLADYVDTHVYAIAPQELDDSGWSLASPGAQKVLDKLRKVGVPLEKYVNGKIYFGIKTGLNKAFVIDEATRKKLCEEDPKSSERINSFPKGRGVKRYEPPKVDQFLILFPNGWTRANSGFATDKWDWLQQNYPAIAQHLAPFKADAIKRADKGEYWWELRPCSYYDEFENPKIIYASVSQRGDFTFDENGVYFDKTCYFIAKDDKYLLGLLNSSLLFFYFSSIGVQRRGGYLEYLSQYVSQLPIRTINFSDPADKAMHDRMVKMVERMLWLQERADRTWNKGLQPLVPGADANDGPAEEARLSREIAATDKQIDALVYELYGLTDEEIATVEASVAR